MVKVCMLTSVHPHDDVRIFVKEAVSLQQNGYDVSILCSNYCGKKRGVKFYKQEVPKQRNKRITCAWRRFYKKALLLDCDIYHIHDPELILTGILLKRKGKIVVYDCHEDTPKQIQSKEYLSPKLKIILSKIAYKTEKYADKKFDLVICATDKIRQRYKKGITIHNYPMEEEFLGENILDYNKRKNQICYVGAITEQRGLKEMLLSIKNCDTTLKVAGKFDNLFHKASVKNFDGAKKAEFLGQLSRKDVAKLIGESRAGLIVLKPTINYKESIPIKIFEYMICKTPVIASDFPFWRKLFGNGACIYVDPSNIQQIEDAINFILKNPDVAKKMGEAGQKKVLENYTFSKEKNKLLKAYKEISKNIK